MPAWEGKEFGFQRARFMPEFMLAARIGMCRMTTMFVRRTPFAHHDALAPLSLNRSATLTRLSVGAEARRLFDLTPKLE